MPRTAAAARCPCLLRRGPGAPALLAGLCAARATCDSRIRVPAATQRRGHRPCACSLSGSCLLSVSVSAPTPAPLSPLPPLHLSLYLSLSLSASLSFSYSQSISLSLFPLPWPVAGREPRSKPLMCISGSERSRRRSSQRIRRQRSAFTRSSQASRSRTRSRRDGRRHTRRIRAAGIRDQHAAAAQRPQALAAARRCSAWHCVPHPPAFLAANKGGCYAPRGARQLCRTAAVPHGEGWRRRRRRPRCGCAILQSLNFFNTVTARYSYQRQPPSLARQTQLK